MRVVVVSDIPLWPTDSGWAAPHCDLSEVGVLRGLCDELSLVGLAQTDRRPPHAAPVPKTVDVVAFAAPTGGKPAAIAAAARAVPTLWRALRRADAAQLRLPSKLGAAALAALQGLPARPVVWARWGGEWGPRDAEPPTYRWQRWAAQRGLSGCRPTIVGPASFDSNPPRLPNPTRSAAELAAAAVATAGKRLTAPIRILFCGRLAADKGCGQVLEIVAELRRRGLAVRVDILGDGPERAALEGRAQSLGLAGAACFYGWLDPASQDQLASHAHFALLPSVTEGWPRSLSEAMAWRVVPLATPVGAIPNVLNSVDPCLLLPRDKPSRWADRIEAAAADPALWRFWADRAAIQAQQFSLEVYADAVSALWAFAENLEPAEALR